MGGVQIAEGRVERVELSRLTPHPMNPRPKITADQVTGLAGLIQAQGLLQPVLVRPLKGDRYEVLDGNRRVVALRTLDRDEATCLVRELDDAAALAVMLSANEERADLDPFLEANAIHALIALDGSVKAVANRLGKTARWVAQRLALRSLSPAWAKRRGEEPWSLWPLGAWEQIARLSTEAQEELAASKDSDGHLLENAEASPGLVADVTSMVADRLRVIGKAPFDPEDAKLVRGCPACSACPKTSQSVPGLFDDGEPTDLASATCRDRSCWGRKASASVRAKVAEARERVGDPAADVVLREGARVTGVGGRPIPSYGWTEAKEGAPGSKKVVVVGPSGGVSVANVRIKPEGRAPSYPRDSSGAAKEKNETPKARAERLEASYRDALASALEDLIVSAVKKTTISERPRPGAVIALALIFGVRNAPPDRYGGDFRARMQKWWKRILALAKTAIGEKAPSEDTLDVLFDGVRTSLGDQQYGDDFYQVADADMETLWSVVIEAAGLDRAELVAEAARKFPVPPDLVKARKALEAWDPKSLEKMDGAAPVERTKPGAKAARVAKSQRVVDRAVRRIKATLAPKAKPAKKKPAKKKATAK